ncbi:hypothetical protein FisN_10Lh034 [Fistulifera solaris]|uniref:MYND-type domain-containing protein n=1 Tax=Fistulifera solaris TaxID=1519565 RepID=A0A1Z5JTJ0_FISSO|nr:hypothetical protein FisN_10Lh034 [Fistulifera solaris]|eukprot:GAX17186.1 hypothetical protein FisN_10Lh034 [Fistulifera solaris]
MKFSVASFLRSIRLDDSDPDKQPSYEGKDPRLQEVPCCATCHSRPAAKLLMCCSRCKTAWYCSKECQTADYESSHKSLCVSIARTLKQVQQRTVPLRSTIIDVFLEPQNFFESQVGLFGQFYQAQEYMTARRHLVELYVQAANIVETKSVWEKALSHALELMRLDYRDVIETRYVIPFILLNLNRDDDAFDFIRYWMKIDLNDRSKLFDLMNRHFESREGEWIYPRNQNCRFRDVFEECANVNDRKAPLAFLVALLIIKCRIVATYDATCGSMDLAFGTTSGQRIQEVQSTVKELILDGALVNIQSQRQQVERLLNVIQRRNAIILPAFLNPTPLLAKKWQNAPNEALLVLLHGTGCFVRVPGAKAMLEERFGKEPSYNLG